METLSTKEFSKKLDEHREKANSLSCDKHKNAQGIIICKDCKGGIAILSGLKIDYFFFSRWVDTSFVSGDKE